MGGKGRSHNMLLAHLHSASQSSISSPGTSANSSVLCVISTKPRARACPAISTSYGPIGVPFAASDARTSPASRASSRLNSSAEA